MPENDGHKVRVIYEPESNGVADIEETITFSTEKNARDFVKRQAKIPKVRSAQYLGRI
jgi:hypothetical protein